MICSRRIITIFSTVHGIRLLFAYLYTAFGLICIITKSFLIGLFVKYIYFISVVSREPLISGIYALIAAAIFEMIFSNHFLRLSYSFTIVILVFAIGAFLKKRYRLVELSEGDLK